MQIFSKILLSLTLVMVGFNTNAQTEEQNSESLFRSMIIALEQADEDCQSITTALESVVLNKSELISALVASDAENSGSMDTDLGDRAQVVMKRVAACSGTAPPSDEAMQIVKPLSKYLNAKSPPTLQLMSESQCKDDCCVKGWQTWAAVSFYSLACLGGSNRDCCMATLVASYDHCVSYCPNMNCCQDVPISVPPPP